MPIIARLLLSDACMASSSKGCNFIMHGENIVILCVTFIKVATLIIPDP